MNFKKYKLIIGSLLATIVVISSCTNLVEEVEDGVEFEGANTSYATSNEDPADLLSGAYTSLRTYQSQE
jgi:PBP1b-binding outer membrane lipoprotein LpoB